MRFRSRSWKEREFHLRRRSSLIRGRVKFSGKRVHTWIAHAASRIFESPGAPSPSGTIGGGMRTRENPGHYLPSRHSRAVPFSSFRRHIGYDFSKRLTSSQCVICLSSDTKSRETREYAVCVYLCAQPMLYINVYTRYLTIENEKEKENGRQKEIYKVTFYADFLSKNMELRLFLNKNIKGLKHYAHN